MAGVEIPFVAKTIDPDAIKGGSKAARRKEFAKKKWHNELIRFEAQFPNGDTEKFRERTINPQHACAFMYMHARGRACIYMHVHAYAGMCIGPAS